MKEEYVKCPDEEMELEWKLDDRKPIPQKLLPDDVWNAILNDQLNPVKQYFDQNPQDILKRCEVRKLTSLQKSCEMGANSVSKYFIDYTTVDDDLRGDPNYLSPLQNLLMRRSVKGEENLELILSLLNKNILPDIKVEIAGRDCETFCVQFSFCVAAQNPEEIARIEPVFGRLIDAIVVAYNCQQDDKLQPGELIKKLVKPQVHPYLVNNTVMINYICFIFVMQGWCFKDDEGITLRKPLIKIMVRNISKSISYIFISII